MILPVSLHIKGGLLGIVGKEMVTSWCRPDVTSLFDSFLLIKGIDCEILGYICWDSGNNWPLCLFIYINMNIILAAKQNNDGKIMLINMLMSYL